SRRASLARRGALRGRHGVGRSGRCLLSALVDSPDRAVSTLPASGGRRVWRGRVHPRNRHARHALHGGLAGATWPARLGYSIVAFGVWDIFYYVFLWVMTGWPTSPLDWDILFLIPLPWWGP